MRDWTYRVEYRADEVLLMGKRYLQTGAERQARKIAAIDATRLIALKDVAWEPVRLVIDERARDWYYERCKPQDASLFVLTLTFHAEPPVDVVKSL